MNQDTLEHLYVTGDYSLLLEKINEIRYYHPSTECSLLEQTICASYHSRALIRLGKIKEAKILLEQILKLEIPKHDFISALVHQTSIINLQITQGNIAEALTEGIDAATKVDQKKSELSQESQVFSFWSAFLYFLLGMANYYEFENELAEEFFLKSMHINKTNRFIQAKCLYYLAIMEQEKGNVDKRFEILEESLKIYQSIKATQGVAWIHTWQGQYYLQKGNFKEAKNYFSKALALFKAIKDVQGLNVVNSLTGLMFYQRGEIDQSEEMLKNAFNSSIKIGNPMILSYCFLPLIFLYVESEKRTEAQACIQEFQEFSKTTNNKVVKLHGSLAEAIFLKSSSRFIDKGQAQQKFHKLLEEAYRENYPKYAQILPTSDTDFPFLVISHLIELYIEEFKLSENQTIMLDAQELIDTYLQRNPSLKFSPKFVELSLLKAKMLLVDGEIEKAINSLEQIKKDAQNREFHRLEEKIGSEIIRIEKELQKWDAAISVRERIEKAQIEEYLKKAQKMIKSSNYEVTEV